MPGCLWNDDPRDQLEPRGDGVERDLRIAEARVARASLRDVVVAAQDGLVLPLGEAPAFATYCVLAIRFIARQRLNLSRRLVDLAEVSTHAKRWIRRQQVVLDGLGQHRAQRLWVSNCQLSR